MYSSNNYWEHFARTDVHARSCRRRRTRMRASTLVCSRTRICTHMCACARDTKFNNHAWLLYKQHPLQRFYETTCFFQNRNKHTRLNFDFVLIDIKSGYGLLSGAALVEKKKRGNKFLSYAHSEYWGHGLRDSFQVHDASAILLSTRLVSVCVLFKANSLMSCGSARLSGQAARLCVRQAQRCDGGKTE